MSKPESINDTDRHTNRSPLVTAFAAGLTEHAFEDWHAIQERKRNAEEGYGDTRNDPSHTPSDDTHSPSSLLSCQRMSFYKANNAPREEDLPFGIFKFGHDFEAYVEQWLSEDVTPDSTEVRNVERIDFTKNGLRFVGSTDPVVFDKHGTPIALVEVKTTGSLHYVQKDGVKTRHKAQSHAYALGLQEKYDMGSPPPIFFIYGGREDLDIAVFELEFDDEFWSDTVVDWAEQNSSYRADDVMPPTIDADGPDGYQCGYCDFQERCGNYEPYSKGPHHDGYVQNMDDYWWSPIHNEFQNTTENAPPKGFLPLKRYPESAVVSHLATYPDVKLTPTLAVQFPALVNDGTASPERLENLFGCAPQRDVHDWQCTGCIETFEFGTFDWDGTFKSDEYKGHDGLPTCPECPDNPTLRGPRPEYTY